MVNQQLLQSGSVVVVRRQRWRVVSIRAYACCKVLGLTGAGTVNARQAIHLITPFDDIEVTTRGAIRLASRRAWRRRCRGLLASHGPADRLQKAVRARIDLMAHQLEPALAVVRGLACRVLIADEVGLGKTIQAGLIAAELRTRGMADRILVLTPSGLREQWAAELKSRFDLDAVVMDASSVRQRSRMLAIGVNPWATFARVIASVDYVKRPEVLPALNSCHWDLIIVDEAHGAGPASDRLAALQAICGHASYVVLVTATPHNGSRLAYETLCGIGAHGDRLLVFRRTRDAVAVTAGRRVHRLRVSPSPAELELHAKLSALASAVANERPAPADAWLTMATFQKRAFSSAFAVAQTVGRRLAAMGQDPVQEPGSQLLLPLDTGELDPADEAPLWLSPVLRDSRNERRLLMELAERAAAAARGESKLASLARLLRRLFRLGEQAIVFTEYRDTLLHVRRHLACECAVLHGGMTAAERQFELEHFAEGRRRVLLATDAAGEGLNLHGRCRVVINLELPWNPMRLEQRIGRVDRIGQTRRVHAYHLILGRTGEQLILEHLRAKLARARAVVAAADPLGPDAADDELTLARIAAGIHDRSAEMPGASHQPAGAEGRTELAHLEPEAAAELQRLLWGRRFSAGPDDAIPDDCLAIAARRTPTRIGLNGKVLAVVLYELQDACGRSIARHLLPVLVSPARRSVRRDLLILIAAIDDQSKLFDDGRWFRGTAEMFLAFVDARRRRDASILHFLEGRPSPMAQAGLFDRRALRDADAETARIAELKADLERSIGMSATPTLVRRTALLMADRW